MSAAVNHMRDLEKFNKYLEHCFREDPAPCRCVCPFKLDVPLFLGKIRRGNFNSAYREYRNAVVFPDIVSRICTAPCADACVRKDDDGSVNLAEIERACIRFSSDRKPIRYNMPPKDKHVVIIGGGPSGLTCALKTASRNYRVTLYESRERVGGSLLRKIPDDVCREEIDTAFKAVRIEFCLGRHIEALDLKALEADAVYVATGEDGPDFGLSKTLNRDSLSAEYPGVFLGGGLVGSSGVYAIEHGARASHSIEKYLQTGATDGIPDTFAVWPINADYYRPLRPAPPVGCDTRDDCIQETERCSGCECTECTDACPMLREAKRTPKRVAVDVTATINKVEQQTRRVATRLMNACNQCGLCRELCPNNVSIGECLLDGRRDLFLDGGMPPAFHDFYLRDMEFALSDAAALLIRPGNPAENRTFGEEDSFVDACRYLFFPGCQLGASSPDYVIRSYEFLLREDPSTGLLLTCCGVPSEWAGIEKRRDDILCGIRKTWERMGRPVMIFACMTCMRIFMNYMPETAAVSLYERIDAAETARSGVPDKSPNAGTVCVYDPCSARTNIDVRLSVRRLLERRGFQIGELRLHGEKASCCGVGGHIYPSNPDLFGRIVSERVNETEDPYVAYCSNCRDAFSMSGKECSHILDEIFSIHDGRRPAPLLSQRGQNRRALKSELIKRFGYSLSSTQEGSANAFNLEISAELYKKMERALISETDVNETVSWCEENNTKLLDPETGYFIAHRQIGIITYWVVYTPIPKSAVRAAGTVFRLVNIYSHRLQIQEEV
jgi:Fe-S oxidoreductase